MHLIRAFRALLATAMLLASGGALQPQLAHADACTPPVANPVACENLQPGTPVATWDVSSGSPDQTIQGFTDDISYTAGRTVNFKINTPAGSYKIDIYRLGYYQGNGARLVASTTPTATLPQIQPACTTDVATGLIDCGNWSVSAYWTVPASAVSGVYLAKLSRTDAGYVGPGSNHIAFVVRDDTSHSDVERARDTNHVNLAFFRGNESFWKTRRENSIDGANTNYRTLVSYKETQGGVDPARARDRYRHLA